MAEVVPGRIRALANFEKVKSFYVNFLLILNFHFLPFSPSRSVQGLVYEREGVPGPPLDVKYRTASCGWKILPIPCSYELQNSVHKKFIICLQFKT